MREEFFRHLWTLTRLRYRLIWARMRTSEGRIVLFFALYLLGVSFALLTAFGGIGAGMLASERGKIVDGAILAQWTLTTLFINGVCLSLVFGLGTQEAFSEKALRRYPLRARERFIIRQIIGLLDPIWTVAAAGAFGLAAGFWLFGVGAIISGALAAALFIAASYLATGCLLSFIGRIMRSRSASSMFGIIVLGLLSFGPLAFSLLAASNAEGVRGLIERLLAYTPPGAAAAMMVEDRWDMALGEAALLIVWVAALALLLRKIESSLDGAESNSSGGTSLDGFWDGFYDRIAGIFGGQYAPLVSKSLRYHLRCNLIRFSMLTSPMLILLIKFTALGRGARGEIINTFMLFFVISGATGLSMTLNLFGYDGAGIRRYAVLPFSFAAALRAGSLASLLLRAVSALAAVALWIISRRHFDARMLPAILEFSTASLFLFGALGLWTSVLFPKSADFNAIWNNRLSFGANVVFFCGLFAPIWLVTMFAGSVESYDPSRFWLPGLVMMALSAAFYLFSMKMIEPVLNRRREELINLIAGARDN